jgi:ABC-type glycerol-3-phosphate transport system substrate-binding protein
MSGETKFTDYPEFKRAMELWTQRLKWYRPDDGGNDQNKSVDLFTQGKTGMFYTGTWNISEIYDRNPDIKMDIFPIPIEDAEGTYCIQVDQLFMVTNVNDGGKLPLAFMNFCMRPEVNKTWCEMTFQPGVIKGAESEKLPPLVNNVMKTKSQGPTAHAGLWTKQMYGEFTTTWRQQLQKYASDRKFDKVGADTAIAEFTAEFQKAWGAIVEKTKGQ